MRAVVKSKAQRGLSNDWTPCDEIGELPLADQVKLLRVLQEREVVRVGASKSKRGVPGVRRLRGAGRLERDGCLGGHFAWVAQYPLCDAQAFMKAALEANGWTAESQVRVLADGADGLANLVSGAAEKTTRRVLDWFHISMRLRPIEQMSSGIAIAAGGSDSVLTELLNEKLPRIRYQMWNGKWHAR